MEALNGSGRQDDGSCMDDIGNMSQLSDEDDDDDDDADLAGASGEAAMRRKPIKWQILRIQKSQQISQCQVQVA
ncbi:protein pangolin, isoforms A/H/I/S-like [Drosophila sulfurigaster albostrigata]|uniref:protein pangolin, isoforms A/H/I/S-like n=1 Tax=Drosophila sulfurigaster albostrigata TaxID=89887 RepID=UPI002D2184E4|nr:protein pangolin, isoforms A/H/I/S-like [Drosophila sulfurigaster albostrigata]